MGTFRDKALVAIASSLVRKEGWFEESLMERTKDERDDWYRKQAKDIVECAEILADELSKVRIPK